MANLAMALRTEIARVSRKEIKTATDPLRKASTAHRRDIAELKRQLVDAHRAIAELKRHLRRTDAGAGTGHGQDAEGDAKAVKITPKGIKSLRARLGITAEQLARIVGVTGQSVYLWERGTTSPRGAVRIRVGKLREMAKREVAELLQKAA